jgi:hypothetical protein
MFIAHRESTSKPVKHEITRKEPSPVFTTINTFKELMDYLNHAPEAERTEILLADFSARVAAFEGERVCLGIAKEHYKLIEATLLLRHYRISFTTHKRCDGQLLIYARAREIKTPEEKDDDFVFSQSRLNVRHAPPMVVAA